MQGVILINKTINKTSRDMVNELNHIFDMKRIGHTGTLDPIATGVLVMCLGKYTKLVEDLSQLEKEYIATIQVGIKTDTGDITGNVLEKRDCEFYSRDIEKVFKELVGTLEQEIPIYSAKKINGKKLYEYARSGEKIELPKNKIEIYELRLLDVTEDKITFITKVSKGTYIRSLIDIICQKLNIIGTMSFLERTKQGRFDIYSSYTIEQIKNGDYKLLKTKDLFEYPVYCLNEEEYNKVKNGNSINIPLTNKKIILEYANNEIAIYKKCENLYKPDVMLL